MDFERFNLALAMAAKAHTGQFRKTTPVPYITHPVAVAALVAEFGGNEDQQIAALFHDVLEDAGVHWATIIQEKFGKKVLAMVEACTDGTPDSSGDKAPWKERKTNYLNHLITESAETLLVSACDKLANLRSIRLDLESLGPRVFERFKAGQTGTLWYYQELCRIFSERSCPVATWLIKEYQAIMDKLTTIKPADS